MPLSLLSSAHKKNIGVKKTGVGSTIKKIQNPEWRTSARLCFFSLTGGLFRFFEILISSIGYGD